MHCEQTRKCTRTAHCLQKSLNNRIFFFFFFFSVPSYCLAEIWVHLEAGLEKRVKGQMVY